MNLKIIVKFIILNLVLGLLSTPVVFIAGFCLSGPRTRVVNYIRITSYSDRITGWGMLLAVLLVFILSNSALHKSSLARTEGSVKRSSFITALIVFIPTIIIGIFLISIL